MPAPPHPARARALAEGKDVRVISLRLISPVQPKRFAAALKCKETGEEKTILFLLCGHGHFDMKGYDDYNSGKMLPYEYPQAKVDEAMMKLRKLYPWINHELGGMT